MKYLDAKMKKMLIILGIFVIVLIIGALLINVFKNKDLSYDSIENKLISAANAYYNDHEDLLPIDEEDTVDIDASVLTSEGYMKELSKYQKKSSDNCSGSVTVTKTGDKYNYIPYLNCGDSYISTPLYEKLIDTVVEKDDGLYKTTQFSIDNGSEEVYIYRGDFPNNYIKLDDRLWRIVKIDGSNNIMLIQDYYEKDVSIKSAWDNRFNSEKERDYGINDYYKSIIRKLIRDFYDSDNLPESFKSKIVVKDICSGNRSYTDTTKDGSTECKTTISGDFLSLLPTYDYLNASLDENCKKITDESCANYNYLTNYERNYWLLNANSDNTYTGYIVNNGPDDSKLSSSSYIARLTVYINGNTLYSSGNGTLEKPYIIK